jgi:elongation factor Ts
VTTAEQVRALRNRTGAGVMDCRAALEAAGGDLQGAIEYLRKKGLAEARKKQHREAREGLVASYVHPGGKIGVLVEVNCETDFVARTPDFQELVKDVAMQVAAASPGYVSRQEVPAEVVEKEQEIYRQQMSDQGKPAGVLEKIVAGKLEKFFAELCLLDQPFIRDASGKTRVSDLVDQATARMGERIAIKRFARFQVGEGADGSAS